MFSTYHFLFLSFLFEKLTYFYEIIFLIWKLRCKIVKFECRLKYEWNEKLLFAIKANESLPTLCSKNIKWWISENLKHAKENEYFDFIRFLKRKFKNLIKNQNLLMAKCSKFNYMKKKSSKRKIRILSNEKWNEISRKHPKAINEFNYHILLWV